MKYLFYLFLLIVNFSFSQETPIQKAPKIGLVLSGGGAKGFAHIGVLKVLEKTGVKVDYIAGTSMGAVIGALYASGYSADQIDAIIKNIDFPTFLQDKFPRNQSSFFEKQYGEKNLLTFPIQNNSIGLPKAIARGQNVYSGLNLLLEHVNAIENFKNLPIPFFCIATEIETGNPHVFENGYLPAAVRASASLPTLLEPMEIDGKAYIDGGISDNFPVKEMRKRGVSLIIGVNVQGKLEKKENINSALDVVNQIINYQMYSEREEKVELLDLLIRPDVRNYAVTSFDQIHEIIDLGEASATEQYIALEEIAALQKEKREKQSNVITGEQLKISKIKINSLKNYSRAYILGQLKLEENDVITYRELNDKIGVLSSSGDFKLIQYQFDKMNDATYRLSLQLKENSTSAFLKLGLHYDPLYKSSLLLNYTRKHWLQRNDVLSTDFILGDNNRFNLNYFVDNGFYTSYGLNARFNKFNTLVRYPEGVVVNRIDKNYLDITGLAYIQTNFNKKFATGFGLEYKFIEQYTNSLAAETSIDVDDETTFFEKSGFFNSLAYIKLDTYDRAFFPKSGFFVDGEFKWYMSSSGDIRLGEFTQFSQIKLKLATAQTFFKKLTSHLILEGGGTLGVNTSEQFKFSLGGYGENLINNYVPFYGYEFEELVNHSYLKGALELRYELAKKHSLGFIGNFARTDLDIYNDGAILKDIQSGYAISYGHISLLGPLNVVYSWSPGRKRQFWYFSLGVWF